MIRDRILDLLSANYGEYVSGELISHHLNLTRAAIWKQIRALKEAGYEIEGQTKNGYRLIRTPLSLEEWVIRKELKTKKFGSAIYFYEEVPSTNDRAKELVREGGDHGSIVLARRQTAGHGRLQRHWESPVGGLWMSVILKPQLSLAEASKLTLATGVSVVDAIADMFNLKVGIKWPNDIIWEGKKLAGILAEVVGEWTTIQTMIIGIGVNANLEKADLSPELPATSLAQILKYNVDLNKLAARILEHLEQELGELEAKGFTSLREHWTQRAVGIGEMSMIQRGNERIEGIFQGISTEGELILRTEEKDYTFSAGEVHLRSATGAYY